MSNCIPRFQRTIALLFLSALLLLTAVIPLQQARALTRLGPGTCSDPQADTSPAYGAGNPLPRIKCSPGYSASIYARYLRSPDGLAFSPSGLLYVVEERARRVSQIDATGGVTPVLADLNSPEGIAFDEAGNLYVVEDVRAGRLIRMAPDGQTTTLADDLEAPEGVAVTRGGTVYVTESNIQFVTNPYDLRTRVTAVSPSGEVTRVITHTPKLSASLIAFWSYAGITVGPDGLLYVTNELSGQEISREVVLIPEVLTYAATLFTDDSVFAIDSASATRTLIASGLLAPEGLHFSADGDFPLYVAEESVGGQGRLSRVGLDGRRTTVCTGFRGIEDVAVDSQGGLYVSEDPSGLIILVQLDPSVAADSARGDVDPAHADAESPSSRAGDDSAMGENPEVAAGIAAFLRHIWDQVTQIVRRIASLFRKPGGHSEPPGAVLPSAGEQVGPSPSDQIFQPWERAVVQNTRGQGLHCRATSSTEARTITTLEEGTEVTILRGPVHRGEYDWWQVEPSGQEPRWAAGNWLFPSGESR